jgi:hypothetical protein
MGGTYTKLLQMQKPKPSKKKAAKKPKKKTGGETKTPRYRDTKQPGNHDTTIPRHHDTTGLIDKVRQAVKKLGREPATHRFTKEEKARLRQVIYSFEELTGIRTSENEITRLALNYLLGLYDEDPEGDSLLARLIRAVHS